MKREYSGDRSKLPCLEPSLDCLEAVIRSRNLYLILQYFRSMVRGQTIFSPFPSSAYNIVGVETRRKNGWLLVAINAEGLIVLEDGVTARAKILSLFMCTETINGVYCTPQPTKEI